MYQQCSGTGFDPYTVNVISFSGHGINFDGDAIAVIPQFTDGLEETRFINLSGLARKFAGINYSLNIFLCSMCRVELSENQTKQVYLEGKKKEEVTNNVT